MKNFLQDVRYGLRILTKHSGFTAAAVLTLALGIGANTAIFSLVDGVLLKPLPFEDPDRLLTVWEMNTEDGGLMSVAPPNFQDWRDQNTVFEDVVAFYRDDFTLTGDGAEQIEGAHVSAGTFRMLGVAPALGRELLPEEDQTGGPPAVVLSHPLWQRRYGGSTEILGTAVRVEVHAGYLLSSWALSPLKNPSCNRRVSPSSRSAFRAMRARASSRLSGVRSRPGATVILGKLSP